MVTASDRPMTNIHMLATGGTIASLSGAAGRSATVGAAELLASVTTLPSDVSVMTSDLSTKGSYAFDTSDLLAIVREVDGCLAGDVAGVVVTHGTDVMEESAFLADLVHDDDRPVVFTGAQRPFDDDAPDGPANLRDAISVAAAPNSRRQGVLLAFDGSAYPARGVRKVDTLSSHAFDSSRRGAALRVDPFGVRTLSQVVRRRPLALDLELPHLPRVDVIPAYPGADHVLLDASVAAGAAGIVVEALGAGNVGPALADAVATAVEQNVPALICSRVPAGPVLPIYAGGGARLAEAGAMFATDLSPWQARLLLAVACAIGPDDPAATVREWLAIDSGA